MCGIAGICGLRDGTRPDPELPQARCAFLVRRGRANDGFHVDGLAGREHPAFASEIKAILLERGIVRRIDYEGLDRIDGFEYREAPRRWPEAPTAVSELDRRSG